MFSRIRRFISPPVFEDEDKTRTALLLYVVLVVFSVVTAAVLALVFATEGLPSSFHEAFIPIISVGILSLNVGLYHMLRRGRLNLAGSILLAVLWLIITFWVYAFSGLAADGSMVIYPLFIVLAGLLLGGRGAVIFAAISVLAAGGVFYVEVSGLIDYPGAPATYGELIITVLVFALIGVLLRYAVRNLTDAIARARQNSRAQIEANRELEAIRASLEERVADRTSELERRARYLGLSAQVARDAAAVLDDPQALFTQVVNLIGQQLGFYHIAIFMLDATGERAVLAAASSEGGRRMLAREHQVRIEQDGGIVGEVVQQGVPRIVLDVNLDVEFHYEPELLDTRSQIALPLQARGQIIGVLDVQSTEPEAFSDEDVTVLQTLADQVAMAISNARLFQQAQQAVEAERQAYGQMTQEAWRKMLREQANQGVIRNDRGLSPVGD
ncbi:MAG: GAF domain-containing protein, partial [Anaerolineae bacterium]|nr:GAF domain-containing protein [Anaerolineae bacterium]